MKKNILCAFVAIMALLVQARPVTPEEARQAAAAWAGRNAGFGVSAAAVGRPVPFIDANGVRLWYRVQAGTSCLIVSPVTDLEPVIAALANMDAAAGLPERHPMRAMLTRDMTDRLRKLELYKPSASSGPSLLSAAPSGADAAPSDPAMAAWAEEGRARWARLLPKGGPQLMAAPDTGLTDIDLQISIVEGFEEGGKFTHWDQGSAGGGNCYNYYTPNHAPCGCVATSMAAMMQFFAVMGCLPGTNCPPGLIRETQDHIIGAKYVDASGEPTGIYLTKGGIYDWSILPDDRDGYDDLTEEQRELLGRVAYDCGVAVAMEWTDVESAAYGHDVASALRNVFGFKDARNVSNPTADQYAKLIYHQCRAGAPVQLGIRSEGSGGGHSVLAVGYGEDDEGIPRVRIFTGWGGVGDAWYALPYITTASVPGGSSHNYDVVDQITTMIGYDTNETVPVVGRLVFGNDPIPNEDIEVPGAARTIQSNDDGYFGTRVAPSTTDRRLLCRGKEAQFEIGDAALLDETEYEVENVPALCNALPEAIEFILMNSSVAYTFAKAKELALAEGKAILRVSGVPDDAATTAILDYIYSLDEYNTGNFTNSFVFFFTSAESSNPELADGNPSIGVFLPAEAEQDGRWEYTNGRLAYGYPYFRADEWEESLMETNSVGDVYTTNVARSVVQEGFFAISIMDGQAETNDFRYVDITDGEAADCAYADQEEAIERMVQYVLDAGWDEFCRRTHGIVLTVTAEPVESGQPDPAYGTHTNMYAAGQLIEAYAPDGLVTNADQNVISEYSGWMLTVTNTVTGGRATFTKGQGKKTSFMFTSNAVATLVWILEPKFAKIDIQIDDDGYDDESNSVSPGSGWYEYGETVSFTATAGEGFYFDQWTSQSGKQVPSYVMSFLNQPTLSFRVEEPFAVIASFREGGPREERVSADEQALTIWSVSEEDGSISPLLDDNVPKTTVEFLPAASSEEKDDGDEVVLPAGTAAVASIAASSFTDEAGTEWTCVGWMRYDMSGNVLAEGNGTTTSRIVLDAPGYLFWIWEPVLLEPPTLTIVSVDKDDYDMYFDEEEDEIDELYFLFTAELDLPAARVYVVGESETTTVTMGESVAVPWDPVGVEIESDSFLEVYDEDGEAEEVEWTCVGWALLDASLTTELATGTGSPAEVTLTQDAVLCWLWQSSEAEEEDRRPLTDEDVPVGPYDGSALMIAPYDPELDSDPDDDEASPEPDGTLTLTACINNAVAGYWYAIVSDTEVDGAYEEVYDAFYAQSDGVIGPYKYFVYPGPEEEGEKRFFKIRIFEDNPWNNNGNDDDGDDGDDDSEEDP